MMTSASKQESSTEYASRFQVDKCAKYVKVLVTVLICVFVAVEITLMMLCMFSFITPLYFLISCNSFTVFIILGLNLNQVATYCKYSQMPWKSRKHFEHCQSVGIVCAVWTVAYAIKIVAVYEGQYLFIVQENEDLYTAGSVAITEFLTLIIPFYCVVD